MRARFGRPVMKAVGVAGEADLAQLDAYARVADQLLVDAAPAARRRPCRAATALAFDWRLIRGRRWTRPWMLAGGLTPENVAEAVRLTGAEQVDVSSGRREPPGLQGRRARRAPSSRARAAAPEAALEA